jgi:hypothetical protein
MARRFFCGLKPWHHRADLRSAAERKCHHVGEERVDVGGENPGAGPDEERLGWQVAGQSIRAILLLRYRLQETSLAACPLSP